MDPGCGVSRGGGGSGLGIMLWKLNDESRGRGLTVGVVSM